MLNDPDRLRSQLTLICQLYTNGPMKLVSDKGHLDLVNEYVRLCCLKEPFLDIINAMEAEQVVEELNDGKHDRFYALTEKGFLTVVLMRYQGQANDNCQCINCISAFDELMGKLLRYGSLQLVRSHNQHPHFVGADSLQLCCNEKPFLKAMGVLERYRLVETTNNFTYRLTSKGAITAQLISMPGSHKHSQRALFN
jgi:hypothetical protein